MKTLTEFSGVSLKNASKSRQDLTAAGKTAEELPQAMGEALKLEGDRLSWLLGALEIVEARLEDLKRVVVFTLAEGEKAPSGAQQKGEHYYATEYYPPIASKERGAKPFHKGRGKGDRDAGKKRRGRRDRRGDRPAPRPSPEAKS